MSARFGVPVKSMLRLEGMLHGDRTRKTLWRAVRGEWIEVATSTSARVLADKFSSGTYIVMPAGETPASDLVPLDPTPTGALF